MANFFKDAAGLASAAYMGKMLRDQERESANAMRVKRGLKPIEHEPAPIDKAVDWVGEKFKSLTTSSDAAPEAVQEVPTGDNVGLWDRLKAGNIDARGSEAYNRWGQGREEGIATSDAIQAQRLNELPQVTESITPVAQPVTPAEWKQIPDANMIREQQMSGWLDSQ